MTAVVRHLPLGALVLAVISSAVLSDYQLTVATYILTFSIVCIGLVLMTGVVGMVSFGQAAFVGLGAYATAYVTTFWGAPPVLGLVAALACAAATALVIGLMAVRMGGHYLALVTLCVCISFYFLVGNTEALGQFNGLTGIRPLSLFGVELRGERSNYLVALALVASLVWWTGRILESRVGRVLRSLRAGPAIAETFGANALNFKLTAFVIAALLAALSGWLYAHVQRFVNPTPFGVHMSIEYLFMAVIGGIGHVWGAILGAGLVTLLKQELQELLRPLFGATTRLEMLVFAALILLMLSRARQGLWPMIQTGIGWEQRQHAAIAPVLIPSRWRKAPAGTPLLSGTGLRRTFGGLVAVDDVTFELRAGEVLGLLGPNGAGKSTLFNLLGGALPAFGGHITFMGQRLATVNARDMCRRGMARTFQHVKLIPDMTLVENVALGATRLGHRGIVSATFGLDRTEEAKLLGWAMHQLVRVGLDEYAWRQAGTLPLGRQRILEIARALAADPVVLLLDEPAAGLRASEKAELAALLGKLREEGLGILLVEHDMAFVSAVADRLMVMNFGKLIALGDPRDVLANAQVQEAYLGVAA